MEMDDILAEFDAGVGNQHSSTTDIETLTKFWIAERTAPEVLPYQHDVLERVMERVRAQIDNLENLSLEPNPNTSFRSILLQTELERIKFLIRSYLRCRLHKIDLYPLHILSTPSVRARLSPTEVSYMKGHLAMLNNHYLGAFLRNFPENLRRLNDTTVGFDMVDKPDMEKAVFCRCVRDVPEVLGIPGTGAEWRLRKRDVMVVRYSAVRAWVEEGSVELI